MSGKLIAPCSLTKLMLNEKCGGVSGYEIDFPELLASLVFHYKSAIQKLQLEIIDDGRDNYAEIGRCFEKLEIAIDCLVEHCANKH